MNILAARAEMAVRGSRIRVERDPISIIDLSVDRYFESIKKLAMEQEESGKRMAKRILAI